MWAFREKQPLNLVFRGFKNPRGKTLGLYREERPLYKLGFSWRGVLKIAPPGEEPLLGASRERRPFQLCRLEGGFSKSPPGRTPCGALMGRETLSLCALKRGV